MEQIPGADAAYRKIYPSCRNVSIKDFLHDIRYILIFYIMGDILTTVFALETGSGYEANFIISGILGDYGMHSVVLLKMFFLSFCFLDYIFLRTRGFPGIWDLTRYSISIFGFLVVINNLLVINGAGSPLYAFLCGL
ncbi:MAG: hypothetical protein JW705_06250 [Methanosarcinaceae archaeon]|nr:hypothetical protein [Methanosarcinaceae archaeon]